MYQPNICTDNWKNSVIFHILVTMVLGKFCILTQVAIFAILLTLMIIISLFHNLQSNPCYHHYWLCSQNKIFYSNMHSHHFQHQSSICYKRVLLSHFITKHHLVTKRYHGMFHHTFLLHFISTFHQRVYIQTFLHTYTLYYIFLGSEHNSGTLNGSWSSFCSSIMLITF